MASRRHPGRRAIGVAAVIFIAALFGAGPATAQMAGDVNPAADVQSNLDIVWMLVAAALVLMMQAGFTLLEAGLVRSKNSINVALKNLMDLAASVVAFAVIGFTLAFGRDSGFLSGFDSSTFLLGGLTAWGFAFFVFQVMFCGTSATIISGAVAERMKLSTYVVISFVMAGLIYPVFAHWAWGTAIYDNQSAFLAQAGFVDFAGSTVVHSTGAWVALAICVVMGPRIGKFDADGRPVRIQGHSPVLAVAGVFLLFFGWIGFNGGSTTTGTGSIAHIIANTVLAAATGALAGFFLGRKYDGMFIPERAMAGMIGGLVAITAGCNVLGPHGALLIGALGGLAAIWGNQFIEHRLKVDDAVGAIGVHGIAGIVGTLGLALFAPVANLPLGNRFDQLVIQGFGVALNFVWAFGLGYILVRLFNHFVPLRVSREAELRGLNDAEHGARLGVGHVEDAMSALASGRADLSKRLPTQPGDDAELLTMHFNALMDRVELDEKARALQTDAQRSAEEAERLTALSNAAFESIVVVVDGRIVDGNQATEIMLAQPMVDLKGQRLKSLMPYEDWPAITKAFTAEQSEPFETTVTDRDGNQVPVEVRGRQIVMRGAETLVLALRDMRERKNAEARIRHLALHDPLTDLPNRTVFQDRLGNALSVNSRTGLGVSLFLIDLDHFKDVNDIHGHPVGDKVIMAAAQRLSESVRASDTVARLGGDEFAVIQTGFTFGNQVTDLAGRIVKALAMPIPIGDGMHIRCGASVGVAICPHGGCDVEQIISQADAALYRAKGAGRSTFRMFEPGMDAAIRKRQLLQADLTEAVDNEAFELYFQPQADVVTGTIKGYEALLRWQHPEKGTISPVDFIPVAEETGLILPLGRWVLRRACTVAQRWPGRERIAVNVSPIQFRDRNFVGTVIDALEETGLDPTRLELEVTESVAHRRRPSRLDDAAAAQGAWRQSGARRFRHRLRVAELSAPLPLRPGEDRSFLHPRQRFVRGLARDHSRHRRSRQVARHEDHRRGR